MGRFWSWLAVWCGKHAGLVGIIGLLLTLTLALGTTQLKFQTSQASYLNKSDQAYKDDVRYEHLFGGQAMVIMFTMTGGRTVDQLFTPANLAKFEALDAELHANAKKEQLISVIAPTTVLDFSADLVTEKVTGDQVTPASSILESVAGQALQRATTVPQSKASIDARNQDAVATLNRDARRHRSQDPQQPRVGQVPAVQHQRRRAARPADVLP